MNTKTNERQKCLRLVVSTFIKHGYLCRINFTVNDTAIRSKQLMFDETNNNVFQSWRKSDSHSSFLEGDGMTEEGAKSINEVHNGMQFSTIDRDNDKSGESCATEYKGGWWYNTCINSNLNAPYSSTASVADWHGILWYQWRGYGYSLKETAMMIRKN